jgi:hypothetical protein
MEGAPMMQLPKSGATREKPATIRGIWAEADEPDDEWKAINEKKRSYPWGEQTGIPKFKSREEAAEFIKDYAYEKKAGKKTEFEWRRGSNPEPGFEHMNHIFTMLVEWSQIEKYLLPKIEEYDWRFPSKKPQPELPKENRYASGEREAANVVEGLQERLNLSFHKTMGRESTINTLRYLFFHMRCGIFVSIRQQQVVLFAPFANKDYKNDWGGKLRIEHVNGVHMNTKDAMSSYYNEKERTTRAENILGKDTGDTSEWYANGNIICNEHVRPGTANEDSQYFGDQFLVQLKDMLQQACRERQIDDAEFFINKRDYPQLKANPHNMDIHPHPAEPYGFIYDRDDKDPAQDLPLKRHRYTSYAPILSFYISKRFADLPVPCSEDWDAATGLVFPHGSLRDAFTKQNLEKHGTPWESKRNVAFFRGNATGGGVTVATNQRLHLAQVGAEWAADEKYSGRSEVQLIPHPQDPSRSYLKNSRTRKKGWPDPQTGLPPSDILEPYLDAQVTGTNPRDKKIAGEPMTFIRYSRGQRPAAVGEKGFAFEIDCEKHYVEFYLQSTYKYILYVEGHCAANRYGFLMLLGCVILKVESKCVADAMWFFPVLTPLAADGSNWKDADHVTVAEDLSDLAAKIEWCRAHDQECKQLVANAEARYKRWCSRDAILDYVQLLCHEIGSRWGTPPAEAPTSTSTAAADTHALNDSKVKVEGVKVEGGSEEAEEAPVLQDHEGSLAAARAVGTVTGSFSLQEWWQVSEQRPPPAPVCVHTPHRANSAHRANNAHHKFHKCACTPFMHTHLLCTHHSCTLTCCVLVRVFQCRSLPSSAATMPTRSVSVWTTTTKRGASVASRRKRLRRRRRGEEVLLVVALRRTSLTNLR